MALLLRSLLVAAFALFGSACWQHTDIHREGQIHGFLVGASSRAAFDSAMRGQRDGVVRNLVLVDEQSGTYDEKYTGSPMIPSDFPRVAASSLWQANLSGCNCWLRLHFESDVLVRIEESEWTGPTE